MVSQVQDFFEGQDHGIIFSFSHYILVHPDLLVRIIACLLTCGGIEQSLGTDFSWQMTQLISLHVLVNTTVCFGHISKLAFFRFWHVLALNLVCILVSFKEKKNCFFWRISL